ncbi:MAG TPA: hypothetical protein VGN24_04155 [Rhodanobacter sp.]|nr:hypothetical protein [Rhodanobacter sp.]
MDPDNRRAVDYGQRHTTLDDGASLPALLHGFRDGRIKQRLIRELLRVRPVHAALFCGGEYMPLRIVGGAVPMLGFMRGHWRPAAAGGGAARLRAPASAGRTSP